MTVTDRAAAYLAKLPAAVSGQDGHGATYAAACRLVEFGLEYNEALRLLLEYNSRCQPPWSEGELKHKLSDAFKETGPSPRFAAKPRKVSTPPPPFDWQKHVAAFTEADARKLADWRGFSPDFVRWLHAQGNVGTFKGNVSFPNHGAAGQVVSCHVRLESGNWLFEPKGQKTAPLIFGDVAAAGFILAFESQWDAFAVMDRLGWHATNGLPDAAVFITRGSGNGKLVRGRFSPDAVCYAFEQNDQPQPGKKLSAAQEWTADLAADAGCKVVRVVTPAPHKDANDWAILGATKAQIEAAMLAAKPVQAAAPTVAPARADSADIRGKIIEILTDEDLAAAEQRRQISEEVVSALAARGRFYFHADLRDFDSAMFFDNERKRLERIRCHAFNAWVSEWLRVNRADALFKYIAAAVETAALSSPHTTGILPEAFWAARPGAVYLSNGDGQLVKVTAQGVALADNGTDGVLFAAGRTLTPWKLTEPKSIFETCRLFRDAHCTAAHGKNLLQLWLYSVPSNPKSKPPLCLPGPVGSGKTREAKGCAEFYGLPFVAHKVEEAKEDDFWPCVDAGGIFTLDNADTRCRWLADALANAATDGCSQRRRLYTNSETVVLRPRAWLCVTTANPTFAADSGLADRLLVVRMDRRDDDETSDAALTAEILANRDAGISHVAETLRTALADTAPTPTNLNRRHPDFAALAVRIGRALGRETEAVAALQAAEQDKAVFCLENDPVASALLLYLRDVRTFTGTAAELVPKLIAVDGELTDRLSARRLTRRLSALWPHLQGVLKTAKREEDRKGFSVFTLKTADSADFADFELPISLKPPHVCV